MLNSSVIRRPFSRPISSFGGDDIGLPMNGLIGRWMYPGMVDTIGLSTRPVQKKWHLLGDGTGYLANATIVGTETVVSKEGTSEITIAAGRINVGSGTLYDFELSNGSIYKYPAIVGYRLGIFIDVSGNNRHLSLTGFGVGNANIATAVVESLTVGSNWINVYGYSYRENLFSNFIPNVSQFDISAPDGEGFVSITKITATKFTSLLAQTVGAGSLINSSSRYAKMVLRKLPGATNTSVSMVFYNGAVSGSAGAVLSGPGSISGSPGILSISGLSESEDTTIVITKNDFTIGAWSGTFYFYPGGTTSETIGHGFRLKNFQIGNGLTPQTYTQTLAVPLFLQPATIRGVPPVILKLVAIGDSLTNGYVSQLRILLPGITIVESGVGGNTSAQVLARFQADVVDVGATQCTLLVGVNDAYHDVSLLSCQSNILACISLADANNITITLAQIPPSGQHADMTPGIQSFIDDFNIWVVGLGRPVASLYQELRDGDTDNLLAAYDNGDHLHLSVLGYSKVANSFFAVLPLTFTHGDCFNNPLQFVGRCKKSLIESSPGVFEWPVDPEIVAVVGLDNAIYTALGAAVTFASPALALAAMASLADDTYLFVGDRAAALYSVDMSARAEQIKRYVRDAS